MLVIAYTRNKTCFVLFSAHSPWPSPGPPMPRLFLHSPLLFHDLPHFIHQRLSPSPRKVHLWSSQPHLLSPVILCPDSLSQSWAWSLGLCKHEGEESPLLVAVWSPVVLDLFPGQEPPQPPLSAAHRHNLYCIALQPQWKETDFALLICWCLVYLPNKAGRGSYAWHFLNIWS